MKFPNWRWLVVFVAIFLVTQVLVLANFLPWLATIVGAFVGLLVYDALFRVKKTGELTKLQQTQADNRARDPRLTNR